MGRKLEVGGERRGGGAGESWELRVVSVELRVLSGGKVGGRRVKGRGGGIVLN